jgi:hypothetical protein
LPPQQHHATPLPVLPSFFGAPHRALGRPRLPDAFDFESPGAAGIEMTAERKKKTIEELKKKLPDALAKLV